VTSKPAPPKPAGPGPKPGGPTHPTPTGPPHDSGHELPPLTPGPSDAALRPPGDPGTNPDPRGRPFRDDDSAAAGVGLPTLGMVIRDAERLCAQLINLLGRDYDPASALNVEAYPGERLADVRLAMLRSDVIQVARGLADLASLRHPPAGSAVPVQFPDRPSAAGEGRSSGLAATRPPASVVRGSLAGPDAREAGANVST
jgi:hypothetical protein